MLVFCFSNAESALQTTLRSVLMTRYCASFLHEAFCFLLPFGYEFYQTFTL